jgi:hypothetical protein
MSDPSVDKLCRLDPESNNNYRICDYVSNIGIVLMRYKDYT